MTLKITSSEQYQQAIAKIAKYPDLIKFYSHDGENAWVDNLSLPALGIAGEWGEVLEKALNPEDIGYIHPDAVCRDKEVVDRWLTRVSSELGDVAWNIATIRRLIGAAWVLSPQLLTDVEYLSGELVPQVLETTIVICKVDELVKKIIRDNLGELTDDSTTKLAQATGQAGLHWTQMCHTLGVNPLSVLQQSFDKQLDRFNRGVTGGSGDNR